MQRGQFIWVLVLKVIVTSVTFYCYVHNRETSVPVEDTMRSKIFFLLMLFTPGILGIPPIETNDAVSTELLITDGVLHAKESSGNFSNGVSKGRQCMCTNTVNARKLQ